VSLIIVGSLSLVTMVNAGWDAKFVNQSVPSTMITGQTYQVSITMSNPQLSGFGPVQTCGIPNWRWSEACGDRLGSQNPQDNTIWGSNRQYLARNEIIKEGQNKTFTFNVVAPSLPGVYNFQWQMVQDGVKWFGDKTPNIAINVTSACVAKTCVQLGYTCGTIDDGCGNALNCGTCANGKTCINNKCLVCTPNAVSGCKVCKADGSAWVDTNSKCNTGQTCQNGTCVAECTNECSSSGAKQCNGAAGYQTCGNYDADSCLEWSSVTNCPSGQTCSGAGICGTTCISKTCTQLSAECGTIDDGCGKTINCGVCSTNKTCSDGQCVSNCISHAAKKCSNGNLYWYNSCDAKEELSARLWHR